MTATLIDTNILVYSFDLAEPLKNKVARDLLKNLQLYQQGFLSNQSVGEFYNVVSHGKLPKVTLSEAILQLEFLLQTFPVYPLTLGMAREAVRIVREHQISYYDAQIWACAKIHEIPIVFSEDFQDRQILEGVRFVNPFTETFELEKWIQ